MQQRGEAVIDTSTGRRTVSGKAKRPQSRGRTNSRDGAECIRARETERVLRKLGLSREQAQVVERLTSSLANELVHGPITRINAIIQAISKSAAGGKHDVIKVTVSRCLTPSGSSRWPARGTAGLHSLSTTPTLVRADLRGQEGLGVIEIDV